ncbi:hypothetical protein F2P81_022750 [Scophthalmus maximus]|uniref:C-type lectin domain-containing protein n=3 Tax=Scophthalmus maximus TaxID=52904 RepID=A0A6A4S021_SCOMX|nr:hypothetical protein F2P81_022750 [Scophthalmus maximus]
MVGHQWFPRVNDSTRGAVTATPDKQEQEMSSGFLCSGSEGAWHRLGPLLGLSALGLLLLVTCAALSVLYTNESNRTPDWESLLHHQNMSDLKDDKRVLEEHVARLHQQNRLLNWTSAELQSAVRALTSECSELTERVQNLTSANAQRSSEQEAQRLNASLGLRRLVGSNARLQEEKRRLSETNGRLANELLQATEENRELLDVNARCRGEIENLTERIGALRRDDYERLRETVTRLQERQRNLSATLEDERQQAAERETSRTRDREQAAASVQSASEAYRALDLYCPVVNQKSRERICKKCHNSWKQFESKCYYFSARTLTWSSSRAWCRTQGGDLLIVDSEQEQRFIFDSSSSVESSGARLWIGLTDEEQEGDWRWVDGGRVTSDVQYWLNRPGVGTEPDDWKLDDPQGEDCGHIDTTEKALKSWMDGSCKIAYRWICEKDA